MIGVEPFLNTGREGIMKALLVEMFKSCGDLGEVVCLGRSFVTVLAPCFDVCLEHCCAYVVWN